MREFSSGMIQASFTEEAAWSPVSTHDVLRAVIRAGSPGQRDSPSERRQAVPWPEVRRRETPCPSCGPQGTWKPPPQLRPALACFPRLPESPPPGDFCASAKRKQGEAPAREQRGRGLAAQPAAPQVLFRPRLCWQLPAARGPADERALCLRRSGPARLSFLI